jgi:hypothetical protein
VSVSVSSAAGLAREAGFAERLKRQMDSRWCAKWTFLRDVTGEEGSERWRGCVGRNWDAIAGEEEDDLREDLSGLPFERRRGGGSSVSVSS